MARILIIDDDTLFREMLSSAMELENHLVVGASSIAETLPLLQSEPFDLVFLDVGLPDGDGLALIPTIRQGPVPPEIIIITGDGHADGAEQAIRNGALDYIRKPMSLADMKQTVIRALLYRKGITQLREPERDGIVGNSSPMQRCYRQLAEAASSEAAVLITGETGTGKELFARAIHRNSLRASGPFVTVDCGAIAKTLTESELFGHERGAFTGADRQRHGLVLQADGGTLFLDEVGELALPQQRTFLRVLEDQRFRPVGGKTELFSNFRLVAATNRSLTDMVNRGTFRKDLMFRLQAIHMHLPPLRERLEDVPELALLFVERGCARYGFGHKTLNDAYLRELAGYTWPGNVRELLHVVEQSLIRGRYAAELLPEHLPSSVRVAVARFRIGKGTGGDVSPPLDPALAQAGRRGPGGRAAGSATPAWFQKDEPEGADSQDAGSAQNDDASASSGSALPEWKEFRDAALHDAERSYLDRLLRLADGNVTRASELAGISRQRLYAMMRKHGIIKVWNVRNK